RSFRVSQPRRFTMRLGGGIGGLPRIDRCVLERVLLALTLGCCTRAGVAGAQRADRSNVQRLIGCWNIEHGAFSVTGKTGVDPGQTILPSLLHFDSVPGKSWTGEPLGRLVQAVTGDKRTQYRRGYYLFSGEDSVHVVWTNGFVGMTLFLRM